MSAKYEADKAKPGFPWTARQRRGLKTRRLGRKQVRKASRNK
jgi:hypothetical protein